jgi:hypothetical protein
MPITTTGSPTIEYANVKPNKAIGLEPQIGSWLALKPTGSLRSLGTEWRRASPFHETGELGQANGVGIAAGTRGEPKRQNQKPL